MAWFEDPPIAVIRRRPHVVTSIRREAGSAAGRRHPHPSRDVRGDHLQADAACTDEGYGDSVPTVTSRYERFAAWFRALNPWAVDAVLGTVFTVLGLVGIFSGSAPKVDYRDADAVGALLSLGCTLPFFFRRRAPFATATVTTLSVTLLLVLDY